MMKGKKDEPKETSKTRRSRGSRGGGSGTRVGEQGSSFAEQYKSKMKKSQESMIEEEKKEERYVQPATSKVFSKAKPVSEKLPEEYLLLKQQKEKEDKELEQLKKQHTEAEKEIENDKVKVGGKDIKKEKFNEFFKKQAEE